MVLNQLVTVTQIDPDTDTNTTATGTALGFATDVSALKRSRRRQPFGVSGGELPADTCRFVFQVSAVSVIRAPAGEGFQEAGPLNPILDYMLTIIDNLGKLVNITSQGTVAAAPLPAAPAAPGR